MLTLVTDLPCFFLTWVGPYVFFIDVSTFQPRDRHWTVLCRVPGFPLRRESATTLPGTFLR